MEWNKDGKRHLKIRILSIITIVLTGALIVSTGISFIYFEKNVRDQKISDEQIRQEEVAGQIKNIMEDIRQFSISIVADEVILDVMTDLDEMSEFEKLKQKDTISKRLAFFNGFRTFLCGSFLEMKDGRAYSSNQGYQENYLTTKLETRAIQQYKQEKNWILSEPYNGINVWKSQEMFCYRMNMMDLYSFGTQCGTLYLEIDKEHLLSPIMQYAKEQECVCVVGNVGTVLLAGSSGDSLASDLTEYEQSGIYRVKKGYLLVREIKETGWRMGTLITRAYLWQQSRYVFIFFLLSFLLSVTAIVIIISKVLKRVIDPISSLSEKMSQNDYKNLQEMKVVQTQDEIQTLYECYNKMILGLKQGVEEKILYEKRQRDLEFEVMLSQIHPHYLYNVLNTVTYLAASGKNEEVVQISQALIYSLQETLRLGEKNKETTVEKELEFLSSYLTIQKYRYPDLFEVQISCAEEAKKYVVPRTIIQPLVENAIVHGILSEEEYGCVWVTIESRENVLTIEVTDDGGGISEDIRKKFENGEPFVDEKNGRFHIGINNIRDRIHYLYGKSYGMQICKRACGGTSVILTLPIKL